MSKFRAVINKGEIQEVEVLKETSQYITYKGINGDPIREQRNQVLVCFFGTLEEAKAHLIDLYTYRIEIFTRTIEVLTENLERVKLL